MVFCNQIKLFEDFVVACVQNEQPLGTVLRYFLSLDNNIDNYVYVHLANISAISFFNFSFDLVSFNPDESALFVVVCWTSLQWVLVLLHLKIMRALRMNRNTTLRIVKLKKNSSVKHLWVCH